MAEKGEPPGCGFTVMTESLWSEVVRHSHTGQIVEQSVLGLPKVAHRKSHAGRKMKEAPEEKAAEGEVAAVPGATGTAGATPAAKTPEPEAKTKKG